MKPIQAPPHCYAAPKLPIIKESLDKLIKTGQLVWVNEPTPWISIWLFVSAPHLLLNQLKFVSVWTPHKLWTRPSSDLFTPYLLLRRTFTSSTKRRFSQFLISRTRFKPLSSQRNLASWPPCTPHGVITVGLASHLALAQHLKNFNDVFMMSSVELKVLLMTSLSLVGVSPWEKALYTKAWWATRPYSPWWHRQNSSVLSAKQ